MPGVNRGEGRAAEGKETRSEKVILADSIRVFHLLKPTQSQRQTDRERSETVVSYEHNTGWFLLKTEVFPVALTDSCLADLLFMSAFHVC